jgi:hypothetical protein
MSDYDRNQEESHVMRAAGMIDWARADERQRCAEAMCWRCRAGHVPVKIKGHWVHKAPPIEGTSWCSANNIHSMGGRK